MWSEIFTKIGFSFASVYTVIPRQSGFTCPAGRVPEVLHVRQVPGDHLAGGLAEGAGGARQEERHQHPAQHTGPAAGRLSTCFLHLMFAFECF